MISPEQFQKILLIQQLELCTLMNQCVGLMPRHLCEDYSWGQPPCSMYEKIIKDEGVPSGTAFAWEMVTIWKIHAQVVVSGTCYKAVAVASYCRFLQGSLFINFQECFKSHMCIYVYVYVYVYVCVYIYTFNQIEMKKCVSHEPLSGTTEPFTYHFRFWVIFWRTKYPLAGLKTESDGNGWNLRWNLLKKCHQEAACQQRRTNLPRFSSSRRGCLANMEWCQQKGKTATVLSKDQPFAWLFSWKFRLGYMDSRNPDVRNGFARRQPPLKESSGIVMGLRLLTLSISSWYLYRGCGKVQLSTSNAIAWQ